MRVANMDYLGIDVSCAIGSLRHGQFPEKDCLLPLISKLLGYAIVAASTTVKLPQVPNPNFDYPSVQSFDLSPHLLDFFLKKKIGLFGAIFETAFNFVVLILIADHEDFES